MVSWTGIQSQWTIITLIIIITKSNQYDRCYAIDDLGKFSKYNIHVYMCKLQYATHTQILWLIIHRDLRSRYYYKYNIHSIPIAMNKCYMSLYQHKNYYYFVYAHIFTHLCVWNIEIFEEHVIINAHQRTCTNFVVILLSTRYVNNNRILQ